MIDGELDPIVHQHGRYEREQLAYGHEGRRSARCGHSVHLARNLLLHLRRGASVRGSGDLHSARSARRAAAANTVRMDCRFAPVWTEFWRACSARSNNWDGYCAVRRRIPTIALTEGDHLTRRHHEIYRDSIKVHATAARLPILKRLFAPGGGHATLSFQRLAASLLNAGLAALQAVKLRRLAAGVARRLLSMEARHRISTLRQLALVAQPACTNEWFHKRRV